MECITVQEASEKWGVSIRRVQYLCNNDMIPGAVRFGKVWTIPKEAKKPKDGRNKVAAITQNSIAPPFLSLCANEEMLSKVIEFFPYPIQVYLPDGTIVLVNEASLVLMHISKNDVIGKFNILKDPIIDKWGAGVRERISRSFQGETVQFHDLKMPVQGIINRFSKDELCFDINFQNITCYPIYNDKLQLAYVVNVFITSRLYSGKEEMVKAKEFIESHWMEEFSIDKVVGTVNLSKFYFTRQFKKHTGVTPYGYYQDVKINKLKEKLCDKNLSISQVFANCGVDYNGYFSRIFKEKVGMTPTQYRMSMTQG